ncbi:Flp pilus assembly protein CpaB [Abditibacterium utsteinense]|uniref:Flp pilus assembly protein CpaB n=1 Tax=Abditibacterium utsteinense TaxID=1960156 RepID=A0A2S8STW3_9BACT|nr:RcpC/CpaB family pilus assembly protein [Abditibacterium utsteinense]PQV64237.1 Flp pilus assembly protein CpaB [Abditibacterium utsteinense]
MGSNRKLILGAVLLASGLVFWGLWRAVNNVGSRSVAVPTPVTAVQVSTQNSGRLIAYAASDIPQGTLVTKNMLAMRPLAGGGPTTAFITSPEEQALGFVTSTRIPKGALIRPSDDFVGHISETGVAGMLLPGRRAIVIPFANKPTLHDLVAIGNFVDINAAFDGQESRTIVPNVRVLAVDVFGSDFPQVNIARRGAYKADVPGAAPAPVEPGTPGVPGATPTPTPAPAQAPARPDPAITLEVTPAQANTILLAQASGGVLDFVVLPTTGDPSIVGGQGTAPDGTPIGSGIGQLVSSVTRAQIAPYAERKKAAGGAGGTRTVSGSNGGGNNSGNSGGSNNGGSHRPTRITRVNDTFGPPPTIPNGNNDVVQPPYPVPDPAPVPESPTYNIPIYADGKTVRVETVPRPQD